VLEGSADAFVYDLLFNAVFTAMHGIEKIVTRYLFEINRKPSMGMSFFDSVLPWFRGVGVSKRRTQTGTLVLRLMGRCTGLKRPCTGPCLEGRAKKDISMLGSLGWVTNSHRALANRQERRFFKELKCYRKLYFSINRLRLSQLPL
jgi:hypothetical protein